MGKKYRKGRSSTPGAIQEPSCMTRQTEDPREAAKDSGRHQETTSNRKDVSLDGRDEEVENEHEPEVEYAVESILGCEVRFNEDGPLMTYAVKWEGYSHMENTFEPEECLSGAIPMLRKFQSDHRQILDVMATGKAKPRLPPLRTSLPKQRPVGPFYTRMSSLVKRYRKYEKARNDQENKESMVRRLVQEGEVPRGMTMDQVVGKLRAMQYKALTEEERAAAAAAKARDAAIATGHEPRGGRSPAHKGLQQQQKQEKQQQQQRGLVELDDDEMVVAERRGRTVLEDASTRALNLSTRTPGQGARGRERTRQQRERGAKENSQPAAVEEKKQPWTRHQRALTPEEEEEEETGAAELPSPSMSPPLRTSHAARTPSLKTAPTGALSRRKQRSKDALKKQKRAEKILAFFGTPGNEATLCDKRLRKTRARSILAA